MPLILINRDEAAKAGDFSKPVLVGAFPYWLQERPRFTPQGWVALVAARPATRSEYDDAWAVKPVASGRQDRADPESPVIGFMCLTAWRHEAGQTAVTVYATKDECAEYSDCTKECGIVEVEVRARRIVQPSKKATGL